MDELNVPWFKLLEQWTDASLQQGKQDLFNEAMPLLEKNHAELCPEIYAWT
ncbi:Uncharacterised protein [Providencia rustigianii]|nr:Uncharacterised protein [Providencia rustigianii]